jgi:hypothetical protein
MQEQGVLTVHSQGCVVLQYRWQGARRDSDSLLIVLDQLAVVLVYNAQQVPLVLHQSLQPADDRVRLPSQADQRCLGAVQLLQTGSQAPLHHAPEAQLCRGLLGSLHAGLGDGSWLGDDGVAEGTLAGGRRRHRVLWEGGLAWGCGDVAAVVGLCRWAQ